MDYTVRPVAADEIDACAAAYAAAYSEALWAEALNPGQVNGYIRTFSGRDGFCAWRLSVDGEIAGVALGIVVPCVDAPFLRIEDFCVAPKWQRKGLGGAFLAALKQEGVRHDCDCMMLATMRDYPAHRFYEKNGFAPLKDSVLLYQNL